MVILFIKLPLEIYSFTFQSFCCFYGYLIPKICTKKNLQYLWIHKKLWTVACNTSQTDTNSFHAKVTEDEPSSCSQQVLIPYKHTYIHYICRNEVFPSYCFFNLLSSPCRMKTYKVIFQFPTQFIWWQRVLHINLILCVFVL